MTRRRFILAAFCSALFGMLMAVLTNQGTFTPTSAKPRPPRTETRWIRPPNSIPTYRTPSPSHPATSGNTATPTNTTHPPKVPTTTAPSTSTGQTVSTGTSTPDPTTTTWTDTTTTEGAAMTTTQPTPPPTDDSTAQSIAGDVQGIGPPQHNQRALETLQQVNG